MSGLCIIGNYIFFFLLTPYLAHSGWIRQHFLPRTVAQSWGLLTNGTFTGHILEGTTETVLVPTRLTVRLEGAQQRLSQLYPAFITSTLLLWANTNKFDSYSVSFVLIQGIFFIIMPFTYACPHPLVRHIGRIGYQSALAWSIFYALFPRDVGYIIDIYIHELTQLFAPNPTDVYVAVL
ncbi:unnamed protein product [Cunninghamella echinulata]